MSDAAKQLGTKPVLPTTINGFPADGMNTRTFLAGLALAGLLSDHIDHADECKPGETCQQAVARLATEHADALLEQLANQPTNT